MGMKIFKTFSGKLETTPTGSHVIMSNGEGKYFIDFIKALANKYDGRKAKINIELEIKEKEK